MIQKVIIVSGQDSDWTKSEALDTVVGPWAGVDTAIEAAQLLDHQEIRVVDGIIYAAALPEE